MWDWLHDSFGSVGHFVALAIFVAPLAALAWPAWHYVGVQRTKQRHERYVDYHDLIRRLVLGYASDKGPMVDCQIATAFELRNYREYRKVSVRILEGLSHDWKERHKDAAGNTPPQLNRLLKEMLLATRQLRKPLVLQWLLRGE